MPKPIYDLARRCLGYKFPRMGRIANNLFFNLIPREFEGELFPGIHVRLDSIDITQRTTYWQGYRFEYPTVQILTGWAKPSITHFFDIGSNYGFFSYAILSRFKDILVHAFEPNPKTFALVEEIKKINALDHLQVHCMGLSDKRETLFLNLDKNDSGHSTFGSHPELHLKAERPTPVDSFDNWREESNIALPGSPTWLGKIDAEGFDLKVLNGMRRSLEAKAFAGLVVEVCDYTLAFTGAAPKDIYSFMDSVGYAEIFPLGKYNTNTNAFFVPGKAGHVNNTTGY